MRPRIPLPDPLNARGLSAREGLDAGLSRKRMRGGDLARPFRGVYLPTAQDLNFAARCEALLRRLPQETFLCMASAARVITIPLPARAERSMVVDVGVFPPSSPPEGRGIRGHCLDLEESHIRLWGGMRITSPEETWCSLGAQLSVPELVAAGDYLIHHRMPIASRDSLSERAMRWQGKRGVRKVRYALGLLNDRSESPKESELRVLIVEARFDGLEVNFPIRTSGGYDYRADLAFPARRLIVEYQSAFHETPQSFRADMTRVSRLEADDWKVMQVNKDDIRTPPELLTRIRHVLDARPYF